MGGWELQAPVLRERCELVARRNASHPSLRPSAQKVRRGTCPRTLEEGAGEHHLAPLAPAKNGNQNGIKMTAREPKDLRELLILTSQTPESSNIIPPDNKRTPGTILVPRTHARSPGLTVAKQIRPGGGSLCFKSCSPVSCGSGSMAARLL